MWKLRMGDACLGCAFSYGCCLPCCAVCDTRLATLRTINNSESGLPHYDVSKVIIFIVNRVVDHVETCQGILVLFDL